MARTDRDRIHWQWKEHAKTHTALQAETCPVCQSWRIRSEEDNKMYLLHSYIGPRRGLELPKRATYVRAEPRNALQRAEHGSLDWDEAPEGARKLPPRWALV